VAHLARQAKEHLTAMYNSCWIGLGGPVAWPSRSLDLTPMDFLLGHIKTLIYVTSWLWIGSYSLYCWGSSNLAFLNACVNLCCIVVSFVSRLVAICLDICSKLVQNTTFFQNTSVICLISKFSQTRCDGLWHYKNAGPTYSCLTINLCFGPSYHLMKFGHGVFPHSVYLGQIFLTRHPQIFIVALWCRNYSSVDRTSTYLDHPF